MSKNQAHDHSLSVKAKAVSILIDNEVVLPMGSAVDTFVQLEEIAKTIRDTAKAPVDSRSDHQTARNALIRIATLAEVGAYLAADIGNFVDCKREEVEGDHRQTIISAIKGVSHG